MSGHSFDPKVACRVGVNAAIIYANIIWWCAQNKANNRHMHDGHHWTYNSVKAWCELFPYLTAKQIRKALDDLEAAGMILTGNHNQSAYDRTKWYCPSGPIDLPCKANEIAQEGEPIPDSKPDHKPDKNIIGGKPPKEPVRRASSICDDWEPSERNLSDAEAKGMKREDAIREADRFKDYHLAKGSTFKDWDAAWRTWLNNSARFSPRHEAPKPPGKRLWDIDPSIFNPDGSIRKTQ